MLRRVLVPVVEVVIAMGMFKIILLRILSTIAPKSLAKVMAISTMAAYSC